MAGRMTLEAFTAIAVFAVYGTAVFAASTSSSVTTPPEPLPRRASMSTAELLRHLAHCRQHAGAPAAGTRVLRSAAGDDFVGLRHVADHATLRHACLGAAVGFALQVHAVEIHQRRARGDGVAGLAVQGRDDAGEGSWHLHHGFRGFHGHHGLVDFDAIADGHVPADDLRFLQSFAQIRQG